MNPSNVKDQVDLTNLKSRMAELRTAVNGKDSTVINAAVTKIEQEINKL